VQGGRILIAAINTDNYANTAATTTTTNYCCSTAVAAATIAPNF